MKKLLGISASILLLVGCGGDGFDENPRIAIVEVPEAPGYCFQEGAFPSSWSFCFPNTPADNGEFIYPGSIAGFTHQFGTAYKLRVRSVDIEFPDADASSVETELIEIIEESSAPAGTLYVYDNVQLQDLPFSFVSEGVYEMSPYKFLCGEGIDCDYLVENGESGGSVNIEFTLTGGEIPITLTNWN